MNNCTVRPCPSGKHDGVARTLEERLRNSSVFVMGVEVGKLVERGWFVGRFSTISCPCRNVDPSR